MRDSVPAGSGSGQSATERTSPADPRCSSEFASGDPVVDLFGVPIGIVWRQAGANIFVPTGAPDPQAFRPQLEEELIERLMIEKREARERGIDRLVQEAERTKPRGAAERDRFVARIRWDTEFAPKTTNRRQLAEIGVEVPLPDQIPTSDREVHNALWRVIYGLARLGIFFTETDGISDRAMLEMLAGRVLEDSVSDIPPNGDMSEFIALCQPATEQSTAPPDGLRGPFETDEDDDGSWDAWDAMDSDAMDSDAMDADAPDGTIRPGSLKQGREVTAEDSSLVARRFAECPEDKLPMPPELRRDHLLPQPYRG